MEEQGCTIKIAADWVENAEEGTGIGRFTDEYKRLQKEIRKSAYQSIHKALVGNGK